jgi:hypothetical protein
MKPTINQQVHDEHRKEERMTKMTTKVVGRAMWLARDTATLLGLAAMLAVVLGAATTANAAAGDPLKLGEINAANKITRLLGSSDGVLLGITNNGGGSALRLEVKPGKAPVSVNPEAGTATGLSADRLDGKDSAAFLGKGDKAFNSDKLDGLDSFDLLQENERDDFLPNDTYTASNPVRTSGGGVTEVQGAFCDSGDAVLSGGGGTLENDGRDDDLLFSAPNGSGSWTVTVRDNGAPSTVTVEAVCADFPPLRP